MKELPKQLQDKVDQVRDLAEAAEHFVEAFKYPIDAKGNVVDVNQLNHLYPDLLPALIHHFVRYGFRRVEDKRLIKARPVKAPGYYEDMVAWGPIDGPDDPIVIREPAPVSDLWSVKPVINETFEERQ
jgi:hypothetical protein